MKPSTRFEVFKRDNFTCRYCGRKTPEAILEVDHVIPRAEGGSDDLDNLVTSCSQCNIGKGARLLTDIPEGADLHERTVLIAEQERQIAEYRYWADRQRQREDADIQSLRDQFGHGFTWWSGGERTNWQDSSVRAFIRRLGYHEVDSVLEYVIENVDGRSDYRWAVFCKLCWNRIRAREGQPNAENPNAQA